ncbi:MAG: hypothetical protein JWL81_2898 [Verrucomicrobiales bacterium]|nr:hypothetical protein [Verrucomicrobiales bacterium]
MKIQATKSTNGLLKLLPALLLAVAPLGAFAKDDDSAKHDAAKAEEAAKLEDSTKQGGEPIKYQSDARPFGLNIVDKVMGAGTDKESEIFQKEVLPGLTKFLQGTLGESSKVDDSRHTLDSSKLFLKTTSDVRVYFLGEGAGFQNTLGFDTSGEKGNEKGINKETAELIFPNASSNVSTYDPNKIPRASSNAPLTPGDFVNLGRIAGGTLLDFFLIADGASGGKTVFSTNRSVNADGINHVVAFAYQVASSPYLIIGFEDLLGGGDRDFNDLLFAVDIGAANVRALTSTPEPAMALTLVSFLGLALTRKRSSKFA